MDLFIDMDHGLDFSEPHLMGWTIAVPVVYFALVILFRALNLWEFKTRRGSRASDIMAFEIVAGSCVVYIAVAGTLACLRLVDLGNIIEDRFYGKSKFVEDYMIYPMISYQGWNFILCIFNADLRDPAMLGHHFVTAFLGYLGLGPFFQYQALFFFGLAEWTNVPLTIVDVFKYFPMYAEKFNIINQFARYSFALSFVILRLILWPYYSLSYFPELFDLMSKGKIRSMIVVTIFVGADIFLTFLQFLWGELIV
jgi:hypothetical protein